VDPDIYSIAVAPDGSVWFPTFDVFRFGGETWTHPSTADGQAHNNVRAIAVASAPSDGAGFTLWFGYEGVGIARYVPPD
jgi:hypothetical protein